LEPRPRRREPELRPLVTAIGDEGAVLAVGHRAIRQRERPEIDLVARRFVGVGERLPVRLVADIEQPAIEPDPSRARGGAGATGRSASANGRRWSWWRGDSLP